MPRLIARNLITSLLLLSFSSMAPAKSLPSVDKIIQTSDFFMEQLTKGEVESAYSLISAYLGLNLEAFLERGNKTAQDLKQLEKKIGKPLSYAQLKQQNVGEHFVKVTYLLKYETAALIWELNYYQPENGWKLVDITFNGNINTLFE